MGTPEPQQDIPVPPPYKSKILLTTISVRCCTWKQAVETSVADRAVLPLENSLGGSIHRNYGLLLHHRLHIVGDVRLVVRHCLLANRGVKIENLRSAMSHPQVSLILETNFVHLFSALFNSLKEPFYIPITLASCTM